MATALSSPAAPGRDEQVLDSVRRLGIGVRELLRHALGGVDPNNILQRLLRKGLVRSFQGLPQNRAYYLPGAEGALGPQALQQRLALAWHVLMNAGPPCIALHQQELQELFGLQAPTGAHVLEATERPRVLHVYAPDTIEIAPAIVRHVERARSLPKVENAMNTGAYGFLILVPWSSALEADLTAAIASRDLAGVQARFMPQAKRLKPLLASVPFTVARVATPETLTLALKARSTPNP